MDIIENIAYQFFAKSVMPPEKLRFVYKFIIHDYEDPSPYRETRLMRRLFANLVSEFGINRVRPAIDIIIHKCGQDKVKFWIKFLRQLHGLGASELCILQQLIYYGLLTPEELIELLFPFMGWEFIDLIAKSFGKEDYKLYIYERNIVFRNVKYIRNWGVDLINKVYRKKVIHIHEFLSTEDFPLWLMNESEALLALQAIKGISVIYPYLVIGLVEDYIMQDDKLIMMLDDDIFDDQKINGGIVTAGNMPIYGRKITGDEGYLAGKQIIIDNIFYNACAEKKISDDYIFLRVKDVTVVNSYGTN